MIPADLPVWLVNLDRATDRRARMEAKAAALGLRWTRFPAIDGRAGWPALLAEVDVAAFERNTGRPVLPGEVGCHLSHLGVWRAFLATGAPVALVLEDDMDFAPDFAQAVAAALRVAERWDYLKLNANRAKTPVCQGLVGRWRLNAYLSPATGTGAYLIGRRAAARLLDRLVPMTDPIDRAVMRYFEHDIRFLGLEPFPCRIAADTDSTIHGGEGALWRKFPWHRRLAYYARKAAAYPRRAVWLAGHGMLLPRARRLD